MIEFLPKQNEALKALANDSPAEVVLFGGAAGGSKSFTGCAWQIMRRLKYPETRGLIARSKLDALKKTTLKTFFEVAHLMDLRLHEHYFYNANSNVIKFYNGSEIILKDLFHFPSDPNFDSLGSLEITDWFVDEVSQISKKAIDILRSRVRFKLNKYSLVPKGLMTCNPAKGWLYNEVYVPFKTGDLPPYITFIQSRVTDNHHLPESYKQTLARLPEIDRRRLLDGDWEYDESIDNIFNYDDLLRCFRPETLQGEYFITADIARLGKDRTVIGLWRGLQLLTIQELRKERITEVISAIKSLANTKGVKLSNVICDEDGVGGGAVDHLRCRGFLNGSRATKADRYVNLKAECYFKLAEYVEYNKLILPSAHKDVLVKELDMIRRKRPESDGRLTVNSKEEIAKVHGMSPDYADCVMMRMYFELFPNYGKYSYI
jgi:phage terminase large subunit